MNKYINILLMLNIKIYNINSIRMNNEDKKLSLNKHLSTFFIKYTTSFQFHISIGISYIQYYLDNSHLHHRQVMM